MNSASSRDQTTEKDTKMSQKPDANKNAINLIQPRKISNSSVKSYRATPNSAPEAASPKITPSPSQIKISATSTSQTPVMSPSMDRFSTHAAGISSEQSNGSMALHMSPSMTNLNGGQGLDLASFLKAHSLFAGTGTEFTAQLAKKMHLRHFQAGDSIVKEGEIGRAMFFVMKGFVTVTSQDGETVFAELGHGNFFGEIGTLCDMPRTANVVAKTKCFLAVLMAQELQETMYENPEIGNEIMTEAEHRYAALMAKKKVSATSGDTVEKFDLVEIGLKKVPEFQHCPEDFLHYLSGSVGYRTVSNGFPILKINERNSSLFVIRSGSVSITDDHGEVYSTLTAGCFFGEIGVSLGAIQPYIVAAGQNCVIYEIHESELKNIITSNTSMKERIHRAATRNYSLWRIKDVRKHFRGSRRASTYDTDNLDTEDMLETAGKLVPARSLSLAASSQALSQAVSGGDAFSNSKRNSIAVRTPFNTNAAKRKSQQDPMSLMVETFDSVKGPDGSAPIERQNSRSSSSSAASISMESTGLTIPLNVKMKSASSVVRSNTSVQSESSDVNPEAGSGSKSKLWRKKSCSSASSLKSPTIEVAEHDFIDESEESSVVGEQTKRSSSSSFPASRFSQNSPAVSPEAEESDYFSMASEQNTVTPNFASYKLGGSDNHSDTDSASSTDTDISEAEPSESSKEAQVINIRQPVQKINPMLLSMQNTKRRASIAVWADSKLTEIANQKNQGSSRPANRFQNRHGIEDDSHVQTPDADDISIQESGANSLANSAGSLLGHESESKHPLQDPKLLNIILTNLSFVETWRLRAVNKIFNATISSSQSILNFIDLTARYKSISNETITDISRIAGEYLETLILKNCWKVTTPGMRDLGNHCRNMHCLDLCGCWDLNDEALTALGIGARNLRSIDLSNCRKVTDVGLFSLMSNCLNLMDIYLSYSKQIGDQFLTNISTYCPNVRRLNLQRCTGISDEGYAGLFAETIHYKLQELIISDCSFLTDAAVANIAKSCPNLKTLNVSFCCQFTEASVVSLTEGCASLQIIDASFCGNMISDQSLEIIAQKLPKLERISFRGCIRVSDAGLEFLSKYSLSLCHVNLTSCKLITEDGLKKWASRWKLLGAQVPVITAVGITGNENSGSSHIRRFTS